MNDIDLANQMLENKVSGVSVARGLRKMRGKLVFRVFIVAICLTSYYLLDNANIFLVIIGLAIGATLQDISWLSAISKTWPFTAKVVNWEQVNDIAGNDS